MNVVATDSRGQGQPSMEFFPGRRLREKKRAAAVGRGCISVFERPREDAPSKCRIPRRSRGSDRQKSRECGGLFNKSIAPIGGEPTDSRGGFGFSGCHRPPRRQTLRELGGAVRGRGSAWTAAACRRCVSRLKVEAGHPRERPAVPMAPSDAAAAAGTLSTAARCRVGSPCTPRVGLERPAMAPLPHMSSSRLHSGFRQRQQAGALQTLRDLGGALEVAAAHGLRRLAAAVADGPGWNRALHQRNWRDAFHRVPWPGWNRALHRIVTTGPGV
jgi:hypothetical protein